MELDEAKGQDREFDHITACSAVVNNALVITSTSQIRIHGIWFRRGGISTSY